MLKMAKVEGSSQIQAVSYDLKKKILVIQFHRGGTLYRYNNVPEDIYQEFMDAESKGSYWNSVKGAFKYAKLESEVVEYEQ